MFWRFSGYANVSTIDSILDKPDVSLEELLDESDLIQELKASNAKLIEFLRDESVLSRLLKYIISDKPSEESSISASPEREQLSESSNFFGRKSRSQSRGARENDPKAADEKRMKYAYMACEILSADVFSIYESLLDTPEHLAKFWQYIRHPAPLDPLQAGYFTKVNEALLEKKSEDMIAFMKSLDNLVPDMMRHVDCPMVMDLLLKLISLEKEPGGQGVADWLQTQDLVPQLLSYITPGYPATTQTNAGDFLKAIITISANATGQDSSVIGPNELTRQVVSEPCVTQLITEMLRGGNPLTVGVGIVIEVIRKNNSDYDSETQIGPEPKSTDPIYLGTLLRVFAQHIPDFMQLILSPQHTVNTDDGAKTVERKHMKVAWGERIEPLGFDRFKTCELMAELLHCSNMGLLNEKGSDAAVKARDAERNRLKEQGKLSSAPNPQIPQEAFGTSLGSSEYHHAEAFTPLGESPEDVKRLEVANGSEDDEFENIATSEADPENSTSTQKNPASRDKAPMSPTTELTEQVEKLSLDTTSTSTPVSPSITSPHPEDKPAPLFAKRISPQTQGEEFEARSNNHDQQPEASADQPKDAELQTSEFNASSGISESGTSMMDQSEQMPQNLPVIETEDDGSPVVGDFLKTQFVQNKVVPTVLDFFFRFPWNNFLHNVVYDVVQQVFNGAMDRGYNRNLAIDLFETGRVTDRIIEGQARSDTAQREKRMRLGYMGHLTLIAEEVVKFTERQPAELLASSVVAKVTAQDWIHYVEHVLTETRDRDNAILGGVRPDVAGGPRQAVLNAVNAAQSGGGAGGLGGIGSAALANAGIGIGGGGTGGGPGGQTIENAELANAPGGGIGASSFAGHSMLSGFGSSSDDEDDDDLDEGELAEANAGYGAGAAASAAALSPSSLSVAGGEPTLSTSPGEIGGGSGSPEESAARRGLAPLAAGARMGIRGIDEEEQVGELSFEDVDMNYR